MKPMALKISRPSVISLIGFLTILSIFIFPLPSLALFALLASVIDESKLEHGGSLSFLGSAAFFAPVFIGLGFVLFDLLRGPLRKQKINNFVIKIAYITGTIMLILGLWGGLRQSGVGANIGAGVLQIFGVCLLITGVILHLANRTKQ